MPDHKLTRRPLPDGTKVWQRYGHEWPSVEWNIDPEEARIAIELEAFKIGLSEEDGGLGPYGHFRNIVETFWPSFEWHRWSEWQAKRICETRVTGFTGSASSAKSTIMVLYSLVTYIADPKNTVCMVLTTSIKDAETRIWKEFTERFQESKNHGLTGFKISGHEHLIKLDDPSAPKGNSIQLVAAGDKDRDNALQKLQGAKSKLGKVLICIDEGQDVSDSIFRALGNLANNPHLEVKCTGNAAKRLDTHGQFCQPVGGWNNISVESKEWEISVLGIKGVCVHLDGFDSPNMDGRTDISWNEDGTPDFSNYNPNITDRYPYLKPSSRVKFEWEEWGVSDPDFWRQCRGFWPPSDVDVNTLYSQGDLFRYGAMDKNVVWPMPPIQVLSVDPAKGGGDRFVVTHIKYGACKIDEKDRDYPVIVFHETIVLKIEGSTDEQSYHAAMVQKVRDLAEKLNIPPYNVAVDASAQDAIGSLFKEMWSRDILLVDFSGNASDKPVGGGERNEDGSIRTCKDAFDRKVTEIWGMGRNFMLKRQLAGVDAELAKELSERLIKRERGKIILETKDDYKDRHKGQSPDLADSALIGVYLLRERFGAIPGGQKIQRNPWSEIFNEKKNGIDARKPVELMMLKTPEQFRNRPTPKGTPKGELYRWLQATNRR